MALPCGIWRQRIDPLTVNLQCYHHHHHRVLISTFSGTQKCSTVFFLYQIPQISAILTKSSGAAHNDIDYIFRYKVDYGLEVYTLGFGKVLFKKLLELADIAGGQFIKAVNAMQLRNAFVDISARYPPSIGVYS